MLDRTLAPSFKKNITYSLITPEEVRLKNGSTIYYIEGGDQDVVKVECIFHAGKWHEEIAGAAYFTSNLLNKGTRSKTSVQINNELDKWGIHLEITPGNDFSSISLYCLSKNLSHVIGLFREIIFEPTFPTDEFDLLKNIYLENLKVNQEKTSYLAAKELRAKLFGIQHPYGRDASEEQINSIQPKELTHFHKTRFNYCTVFVAGKIRNDSKGLLEEALAVTNNLKSDEPGHLIESAQLFQSNKEKPGSIQTSIRIGKFIVGRTHEDYPSIILLNHILGGYFGSRLMKNIREEKGLTYGIHSSIHSLKHCSYATIAADVNKENTQLTINEIIKEIVRLQEEKINTQELETARNHFIGSLQSELTTPFAHADKIKTCILFSLPYNYYQNLLQKIDSLSSQELLNSAQQHFNTSELYTVAAG